MIETKVFREPWDVDRRLSELGLVRATLLEVRDVALSSAANATDFHAANAAGTFSYQDGTWSLCLPRSSFRRTPPRAFRCFSFLGILIANIKRHLFWLTSCAKPSHRRSRAQTGKRRVVVVARERQGIFWLIGATDGHAKNFSVSLSTGGRFHLTPLYDVLTAQPSVDARQIRRNQMKLAMAVGNNRHYRINTIVPRHFEETAALSRLPKRSVKRVLEELKDTTAAATEAVMKSLPPGFPEKVAISTALGIEARLRFLN